MNNNTKRRHRALSKADRRAQAALGEQRRLRHAKVAYNSCLFSGLLRWCGMGGLGGAKS
jgi:hypothetical protein